MNDYPKVRKRALWLLSRKNYYSKELERKLKMKGFSLGSVEKVIEDCHRMLLFNDEEALMSHLRRGHGPRYIQFKLQISESEVRSVITKDAQRKQIEKMRSKFKDSKKAIGALIRRGFDYDIIIEIFSSQGVE